MLWHAVHSDSAGRPAFSAAKVAPQSASQRFEVPNVLVGILQRSLARRHPHGDTGHFLESRRMSTLINTSRHNSKWFNVTQNDSKQSKLFKKIVEEPHWNDSKWLEMTRNDSIRDTIHVLHALHHTLGFCHGFTSTRLDGSRSTDFPQMLLGCAKAQKFKPLGDVKVSKWQSVKVTKWHLQRIQIPSPVLQLLLKQCLKLPRVKTRKETRW